MSLIEFLKSLFKKPETVIQTTTIPAPATITPVDVVVAPVVEPPPPIVDKWAIPSIEVKSNRKIEKKLEDIIDQHLFKYHLPDFKISCLNKDGNTLTWLANKALSELKVREATNNNDGPIVELIQETIGGHDNEAWCMGQQQSCVAYAEKKIGVVSLLFASEGCTATFDNTPKSLRVKFDACLKGDIWIWQHGTSWKGHTGNFTAWVKKGVEAFLIEGNTTFGNNTQGKIVREGGGTYDTQRTKNVGTMKLYGVLRPF